MGYIFIKDIKSTFDSYLAALRDKYFKQGAPYELSAETKQELGLAEPTQWTLDRLNAVQYRMAEPLVLYWYVYTGRTSGNVL